MDSVTVLAKALYDNIAETKDELEFRRGDIVTILEQNTAGLEGWWLCSLHGKQGIAPGNRLRLLPNMYGSKQQRGPEDTYDVPPSHNWMNMGRTAASEPEDEYDVPRRQPQAFPSNTVMQQIDSPTEVYDVPRASTWQQAENNEQAYDIPQVMMPFHTNVDDFQEVYNVPSSLSAAPDPRELYDVPPLVSRDHQQRPFQPDEVYDIPPRRNEPFIPAEMIPVQDPQEVYDVPPAALRVGTTEAITGSHSSRLESTESDVVYDIPQSNRSISGRPVISSGLNSLRRMRREIRESTGTRSPVTTEQVITETSNPEFVYDVPPQVSRDRTQTTPQSTPNEVGLLQRLSLSSAPNDLSLRNNRVSVASKDSFSSYVDENALQNNELKITLDEGLERAVILKQILEDAVSSLLTFVKENWRKLENISGKTQDVKKSFLEVLLAVNQFLCFARGATANACSAKEVEEERAPKQVQLGLKRLLVPLEEDLEMLKRALTELDESEWDIRKLAIDNNNEDGTILDEVDSFVMTSRAVSDDATQMAIYIHTHANFIFKKLGNNLAVHSVPVKSASSESIARPVQEIQARPLPAIPPTPSLAVSAQPTSSSSLTDQEGWLDDYDYVAFPDKDELEVNKKCSKFDSNLISGLNKRKTQLLSLQKEIAHPKREVFPLSSSEKVVLRKLELDVPNLVQNLSLAIDKFINAIDAGKPPYLFVALGKHVILCAHKLVFVGDCVYQHVSLPTAKNAVKEQCTTMCAVLKRTVISTKLAALQWPAVPAIQDMVDKMFEIATCAHQIRYTLNNILSGL